MPVDLSGTLRQAIDKLQAEKARIEQQIAALRLALKAGIRNADGAEVHRAKALARGRTRMSLKLGKLRAPG